MLKITCGFFFFLILGELVSILMCPFSHLYSGFHRVVELNIEKHIYNIIYIYIYMKSPVQCLA